MRVASKLHVCKPPEDDDRKYHFLPIGTARRKTDACGSAMALARNVSHSRDRRIGTAFEHQSDEKGKHTTDLE